MLMNLDKSEFAPARFAGAPDTIGVSRGCLAMVYEPTEFYVDGQQVKVSPQGATILELLMREGRASFAALGGAIESAGGSAKGLNVQVHRIRRRFIEAGHFDPIETVRGWGLKLRIPRADEASRGGSTEPWRR